jgi:uncharacterized protein
MSRKIFVNLPVTDLERSRRFYGDLGFSFDPQYSDDNAACLVVDDNIFVMLLVRDFFAGFVTGEVADPTAATGVLLTLSAGSREDVDETVRKALAAGGKPWKEPLEMGPMYQQSFVDPDGHVWELMFADENATG